MCVASQTKVSSDYTCANVVEAWEELITTAMLEKEEGTRSLKCLQTKTTVMVHFASLLFSLWSKET